MLVQTYQSIKSARKEKYGLIFAVVTLIIAAVLIITGLTGTLSFNIVSTTVLVLGIALPIIYFTIMIRSKEVTDDERSCYCIYTIICFRCFILVYSRTRAMYSTYSPLKAVI